MAKLSATLTLKGLDEYLENVRKAGVDIDAAVDRALIAGAEIMQEEMKGLVPVDTGNLRNHIIINGPIQNGNYHYVEIGVINADETTARYAKVVEYGRPKIQARSFIRTGRDRSRKKVYNAMRESLKQDGMI